MKVNEAPENNKTRKAPAHDGRMFCVYKHTLPNGMYYIGATYRDEKRWGKNGCHYKSSKIFYSAIQEFGWDNIKHETLFSDLSSEEARRIERDLIIEAQEKGLSLNKTRGGYNAIYKEKMHEIVGLRRMGLSYPQIGRIYNVHPDTAYAICKYKYYTNYYSEEEFEELVSDFITKNKEKYKRNDGLTPNHNGHLSRRVIKKDKQGNVLCRYESITVAALKNNVAISQIGHNVHGETKTCGGYVYEYE